MKVRKNHDIALRKELEHDWNNVNQHITLIDKLASNQVIDSEVPVISFPSEVKESAKQDLEWICVVLANALETWLKIPTLLETLSNAFNNT